MKGIELPVNVLVIVAIAVIVLIGMIVLLSTGILGANPIFVELERAQACGALKQNSCDASDLTKYTVSNKTGYRDLADICARYIKPIITDSKQCAVKACGCPP